MSFVLPRPISRAAFGRKRAGDDPPQTLAATAAGKDPERALALMAHEMSGPLTAIRGWLCMLQSGDLPSARFPHALEIISRNADRLSTMLEEVCDVTQLRARPRRMVVVPLDLRSIVDEIVESMRPVAAAAGVRLNRTRPKLAVRVNADAGRMAQVVRNLVVNAIKFTPAGGRIDVVTALNETSVRLMVSDTGIGIARSQLHAIFEPFQQGDTADAPRRGLGLGLAVVREIVELHGGRVMALSAGPGKGALFSVSLPREVEGH